MRRKKKSNFLPNLNEVKALPAEGGAFFVVSLDLLDLTLSATNASSNSNEVSLKGGACAF
jgi:hypothetical protein